MAPDEVYRFMVEMRSDLRRELSDINSLLRVQNGRLSEVEQEAAVLRDRSESVRWFAGVIAAFVAGVAELLIKIFGGHR